MKLRALVLVENYPGKDSHEMMYVHVRNKYYIKNNIDVTVLNFRSNENYVYEKIKVISLASYKESLAEYDLLICHAANIKHHYLFLKKYEKKFKKIVFFYHGHEILKLSETYPKDYAWIKKSKIKSLARDVYDGFKFILWRRKIKKLLYKSHLIFVSNWLYNRFLYYVHVNPKYLDGHTSIINNSVGSIFETTSYDYKVDKSYDFITIRGSALDKSKYGIDIVTDLARAYPQFKFLVIGKGEYYKHNDKPDNINFVEKLLTHDEMLKYLNNSRCALLPTKQDTQGVMTCEVATYGIPTITSDIEVCREIFSMFLNVKLVDNKCSNLDKILDELCINIPYVKNETYFAKNTIQKEVDLFLKLCDRNKGN